jgi:hypothetical protein
MNSFFLAVVTSSWCMYVSVSERVYVRACKSSRRQMFEWSGSQFMQAHKTCGACNDVCVRAIYVRTYILHHSHTYHAHAHTHNFRGSRLWIFWHVLLITQRITLGFLKTIILNKLLYTWSYYECWLCVAVAALELCICSLHSYCVYVACPGM